jgi:hypothetical protein
MADCNGVEPNYPPRPSNSKEIPYLANVETLQIENELNFYDDEDLHGDA